MFLSVPFKDQHTDRPIDVQSWTKASVDMYLKHLLANGVENGENVLSEEFPNFFWIDKWQKRAFKNCVFFSPPLKTVYRVEEIMLDDVSSITATAFFVRHSDCHAFCHCVRHPRCHCIASFTLCITMSFIPSLHPSVTSSVSPPVTSSIIPSVIS